MPVPVPLRPVRARIVLSMRIASPDASRLGSSWLPPSAVETPFLHAENPAGKASDTKSAPPIWTKPRRVTAVGITAVGIEESLLLAVSMVGSIFTDTETLLSGLHGFGGALHSIDNCHIGPA